MPLESTNTIEGLDSDSPLPEEDAHEGDDHLRLLKTVLKNIFPGAGDTGFSIPILATETEINLLQGLQYNVQDAIEVLIDNLSAPIDTEMVFYNNTVPAYWIRSPGYAQDYMMRIVPSASAGGTTGGTDDPVECDKVASHTHVAVGVGNHHHAVSLWTGSGGTAGLTSGTQVYTSKDTTDAGAHTHTIQNNTGAENWTPRYMNMVLGRRVAT